MAAQRAEVDTSRPFRSVKEAVAIFGERFLAGGGAQSQKAAAIAKHGISPPPKPAIPSPSSSTSGSFSSLPQMSPEEAAAGLVCSVRRLESELDETRRELMLLKERESEMEVVVASLNAEMHKNMPRTVEPAAAAEGASRKTSLAAEVGSRRHGRGSRERDSSATSAAFSPSLALLLSLGEVDDGFSERKKTRGTTPKKKPIMPLVTDVFWWKKGASARQSSPYSLPVSGELS